MSKQSAAGYGQLVSADPSPMQTNLKIMEAPADQEVDGVGDNLAVPIAESNTNKAGGGPGRDSAFSISDMDISENMDGERNEKMVNRVVGR